MKKKIFVQILFLVGLSMNGLAGVDHGHVHHAKHNMVLFGESEIFASHIVYKVPHNYQVNLSLSLSTADRERYLSAKIEHSQDQFIFLLDPMDIKDIGSLDYISGTVFHVDAYGNKHEIFATLKVTKENFKVIYFDELPLSLSSAP